MNLSKTLISSFIVIVFAAMGNQASANTLNIYSHPSDGRVSTAPYPGSWSTQHAATTGAVLTDTDAVIQVTSQVSQYASGYLSMQRGFFSFDTSPIPDIAKIISASLSIYPTQVKDDVNDQYSTMNIYQGFQASSTKLTLDDINDCGDALTNPTEGASNIDITSISANQYQPFTLNSTGRSWISTNGYTQLCIREGHDAVNSPIINGTGIWKTSGLFFANVEETGTNHDPYLSVTYALPPLPSEQLYVEGTTTPVTVTDSTPEFSAIHRASNNSSIATHYQIQVSASSTAWSSLMWDSGKTSMGSTSANSRMSDVTYTGGTLTSGNTYFWRIKMWNSEGQEGYWSGPHFFVMN